MSFDRPGVGASRKQDWIASQLRRVYDEALQEDIPAAMLALLERLDAARPDPGPSPGDAADPESPVDDDPSEENPA